MLASSSGSIADTSTSDGASTIHLPTLGGSCSVGSLEGHITSDDDECHRHHAIVDILNAEEEPSPPPHDDDYVSTVEACGGTTTEGYCRGRVGGGATGVRRGSVDSSRLEEAVNTYNMLFLARVECDTISAAQSFGVSTTMPNNGGGGASTDDGTNCSSTTMGSITLGEESRKLISSRPVLLKVQSNPRAAPKRPGFSPLYYGESTRFMRCDYGEEDDGDAGGGGGGSSHRTRARKGDGSTSWLGALMETQHTPRELRRRHRVIDAISCFIVLATLVVSTGVGLRGYYATHPNAGTDANEDSADAADTTAQQLGSSGDDATASWQQEQDNVTIPPPPSNLSLVCSVSSVQTPGGNRRCRESCSPARCCGILQSGRNDRSCLGLGNNDNVCSLYAACISLTGYHLDHPHDSLDGGDDGNDHEQTGEEEGESWSQPRPPGGTVVEVNEYVKRVCGEPYLHQYGRSACQEECSKRRCCFASILPDEVFPEAGGHDGEVEGVAQHQHHQNCYRENPDWCDAFAPCLKLQLKDDDGREKEFVVMDTSSASSDDASIGAKEEDGRPTDHIGADGGHGNNAPTAPVPAPAASNTVGGGGGTGDVQSSSASWNNLDDWVDTSRVESACQRSKLSDPDDLHECQTLCQKRGCCFLDVTNKKNAIEDGNKRGVVDSSFNRSAAGSNNSAISSSSSCYHDKKEWCDEFKPCWNLVDTEEGGVEEQGTNASGDSPPLSSSSTASSSSSISGDSNGSTGETTQGDEQGGGPQHSGDGNISVSSFGGQDDWIAVQRVQGACQTSKFHDADDLQQCRNLCSERSCCFASFASDLGLVSVGSGDEDEKNASCLEEKKEWCDEFSACLALADVASESKAQAAGAESSASQPSVETEVPAHHQSESSEPAGGGPEHGSSGSSSSSHPSFGGQDDWIAVQKVQGSCQKSMFHDADDLQLCRDMCSMRLCCFQPSSDFGLATVGSDQDETSSCREEKKEWCDEFSACLALADVAPKSTAQGAAEVSSSRPSVTEEEVPAHHQSESSEPAGGGQEHGSSGSSSSSPASFGGQDDWIAVQRVKGACQKSKLSDADDLRQCRDMCSMRSCCFQPSSSDMGLTTADRSNQGESSSCLEQKRDWCDEFSACWALLASDDGDSSASEASELLATAPLATNIQAVVTTSRPSTSTTTTSKGSSHAKNMKEWVKSSLVDSTCQKSKFNDPDALEECRGLCEERSCCFEPKSSEMGIGGSTTTKDGGEELPCRERNEDWCDEFESCWALLEDDDKLAASHHPPPNVFLPAD